MPSVTYNLNGPKAFTFSYPIRYKSEIVLQVVPGTVVPDSQYQVIGAGPESTGVTVQWPLAPIDGTKQLVIERYVDLNRVSDFTGNGIDSVSLDSEFDHLYSLYGDVNTELDRALKYPTTDTSAYDAETRRIKNLGDPVADQDAATKSWVETVIAGQSIIKSIIKSIVQPTVKTITSDYTITAADSFSIIKCDNTSDITVTLPAGATVGFNCTFVRTNVGEVTFTAPTLRVPTPFQRKLRTVDSSASASCLDSVAGVWMLAGDLTDVLVPPGPGPGPVTHLMYVANSGSDSLSVIDVASGAVTKTISVGDGPYAMAFDGTSLLYVVNVTDGKLSVVSTASNSVVSTVQLLPGIADVVLDGGRLFIPNELQDSVVVVDTATNAQVGTVAVGSGPSAIAAQGGKIFVVNTNSSTISVINPSTLTVVDTWSMTPGISTITAGAAGRVFVGNYLVDGVYALDSTTGATDALIYVGVKPAGVAYDGTSRLYVTNSRDNTVSVIDTSTDSVVATIAVGDEPGGIGFDNAGLVYVTNSNDGTVSVIDPTTDVVTDTITVGAGPAGVTYGAQP